MRRGKSRLCQARPGPVRQGKVFQNTDARLNGVGRGFLTARRLNNGRTFTTRRVALVVGARFPVAACDDGGDALVGVEMNVFWRGGK